MHSRLERAFWSGARAAAVWSLVLVAAALPARAEASPRLRPGDQAPPFALPDLDGRTISLESFRGRPVVLHFWATWCPLCREEMPLLDAIARDAASRIAVLGINLGEKRETIAGYLRAFPVGFPVLLDGRGKVAAHYRVVALPATIVLDAEGRMVKSIGMGDLSRDALESLLKAPAAAGPGDAPPS